MKVVGVILARMASSRLPGKPLIRVAGTEIIQLVLERARLAQGLDEIVIATTDGVEDDEIANWAKAADVRCWRGSSSDVASRLLNAAVAENASYVARINSDSPFLQPGLITQAICEAKKESHDLVTNLLPRTFPYGVSVELLKVSTLNRIVNLFDKGDREHVTRFFYNNSSKFQINNLSAEGKHDIGLRLVIDTKEDLFTVQSLARACNSDLSSLSLREIEDFYHAQGSDEK